MVTGVVAPGGVQIELEVLILLANIYFIDLGTTAGHFPSPFLCANVQYKKRVAAGQKPEQPLLFITFYSGVCRSTMER